MGIVAVVHGDEGRMPGAEIRYQWLISLLSREAVIACAMMGTQEL